MKDEYIPTFRLDDTDEVDLAALRYALLEAKVVVREFAEDVPSDEGFREVQLKAIDRRARSNCARIAADDCVRFEGAVPNKLNHHPGTTRQYAMYAMHPDTAEQIIAAVEFLIKRQGPRLRFHTEPQRHAPKTVRNAKGEQ